MKQVSSYSAAEGALYVLANSPCVAADALTEAFGSSGASSDESILSGHDIDCDAYSGARITPSKTIREVGHGYYSRFLPILRFQPDGRDFHDDE